METPQGVRGACGALRRVGSLAALTMVPATAAALLALCTTVLPAAGQKATRGGGITNLGSATNAISPLSHFPLSGFHHMKLVGSGTSHPVLTFIGTQVDAPSAFERWPVVKALDQFGTFSHVGTGASSTVVMGTLAYPTFDLSRATYHSRYLSFAHVDLLDANGKLFQTLSKAQLKLYQRFARATTATFQNDPNRIYATLHANPASGRALPLVSIGAYVQTITEILVSGDFEHTVSSAGGTATVPEPLSFGDVQQALRSGSGPPGTRLLSHVNAEANIITALICHADAKQPKSVCGRKVIKKLMKHLK